MPDQIDQDGRYQLRASVHESSFTRGGGAGKVLAGPPGRGPHAGSHARDSFRPCRRTTCATMSPGVEPEHTMVAAVAGLQVSQ